MALDWTYADWKRQQRYEQRSAREFMACLMCLTIFGVVLALYYLDILDSDKIDDIPLIRDITFDDDGVDVDPFAGEFNITDPSATFAWANEGHGLQLEMLNALDQYWLSPFITAIRNWENGDPHVLHLIPTKVDYELKCQAQDGYVKVCNGNYGKTRWRGINEVILDQHRKTIHASAARMNDFYLIHAGEGERLYTMCHELGHSFGLPHWDEDLYNQDLGNCMDYTDDPDNNKTPDESNFKFLAKLYGEMTRRLRKRSNPDLADNDNKVTGTGRSKLPDWVIPAYNKVREDFDDTFLSPNDGRWRMLHSNEFGQAHEIDLGEGYVAQIHLLAAQDQSRKKK